MNSNYYTTVHGLQLQEGLRELLKSRSFTHWVTLNFHRKYSEKTAKQRLQLWFMNLNSRLFRAKRFSSMLTTDLFDFFAFPEETLKEEPHFHLLVNLHHDCHDKFERLAQDAWKRILPSGTCDVQRIKDSTEDRERVISYATKQSNRRLSYADFILSSSLNDGRRRCHAQLTRLATTYKAIHD